MKISLSTSSASRSVQPSASTSTRWSCVPLVFLCLIVLGFVSDPLRAGLIQVTTTEMVSADDGQCSLIEAINSANTQTPSGSLPGECPAAPLGIIQLQDGATYTLTSVDNTDFGPTGLPYFFGRVTIDGRGSTIRRDDAAPQFRLMAIHVAGFVTLRNLRFENGWTVGSGGAVSSDGDLVVEDCEFDGNRADFFGGAIALQSGQATLNVSGGDFFNNEALTLGGAVHIHLGTTTQISFSHFEGNRITSVSGSGGAIGGGALNISTTRLDVSRTLFIDNVGGAIQMQGGIADINRCAFVGNSEDPAVFADTNNVLTLRSSTLSGNSSAFGAMRVVDEATIAGCTFARNTGGHALNANNPANVTVRNTIFADHLGTGDNCVGTIGSQGYNLDSDGSCGLSAVGDLSGVDPMLGPLADHGGATTLTHSIPAESPAVDSGSPATPGSEGNSCEPVDQRAVERPVDADGDGMAICDIGAYEVESFFSDGFESGDTSEWSSTEP